MSKSPKQKLVILGFGAIGSTASKDLHKNFDVTAVTRCEMATGNPSYSTLAMVSNRMREFFFTPGGLRSKVLGTTNLVVGDATAVDAVAKTVTVQLLDGTTTTLPFDVLLIATGVKSGFFKPARAMDNHEWVQHYNELQQRLRDSKTVAVVGGGANGVSFAVSARNLFPNAAVHLFASRGTVLTDFDQHYQAFGAQKLADASVTVHTNVRVDVAQRDSNDVSWNAAGGAVRDQSGKVLLDHADLIVWATGGVPNTECLPREWLDESGRVKVDPTTLIVVGQTHIFAAGDILAPGVEKRTNTPIAQAQFLPGAIKAVAAGKRPAKPFKPSTKTQDRSIAFAKADGLPEIFAINGPKPSKIPWGVMKFLIKVFNGKPAPIDVVDKYVAASPVAAPRAPATASPTARDDDDDDDVDAPAVSKKSKSKSRKH